MSPEELKNRFAIHGIECRVTRDEVLLQTCVFCGNTKWNLEANPVVGVYHCWTCNAGGRVDALLKQVIGITVHIPVQLDERREYRPRALSLETFTGVPVAEVPFLSDYLKERHLSTVDMAIYQLKEGRGEKWENRVVFPLLEYWTRRLVGYMGRAVVGSPKYYSQWLEGKCIVGYRTRSETHVIVEGVMDGVRVHKAGFNAAVLIGTGAVKGAIEEWAARVPAAHNVVVMLDGDATMEAERLYWSIVPIHPKAFVFRLLEGWDPATLSEAAVVQAITGLVNSHPCLP